jgi:chromosome segregation ATPase
LGGSAELEDRCHRLQLELSRGQDARRRAETDARQTAEQNQQLREKLQVLADSVTQLEVESHELKCTVTALARASS